MLKHRSSLLFLLCALAVPPLLAQDAQPKEDETILDLMELMNTPVRSATKTSKKLNEAPGIISVITAADIERTGARNLADLLKFSTGFQIWTQGTGRTFAWVRGAKADLDSKIMLVIDGVPSREITYSEWDLDYSVPLINVERIEIIRGPGSALYGGQAYSGVISVYTRSTAKGSEAVLGAGNESTKTGSAAVAFHPGKWGFLASAFAVKSDGYPMKANEVGNSTEKVIKDDGYSVLLKVDHSSGLLLEYQVTGFESDEPLRPMGTTRPNTWRRQRGLVGFEHALTDWAQFSVKVYTDLNTQDERVMGPISGTITRTQTKSLDTALLGFIAQGTLDFKAAGTLVVGASDEIQKVNRLITEEQQPTYKISGWLDPNNTGVPGDNTLKKSNSALFAQYDLRPMTWMGVTTGLRYDKYETFGSNLSPRIGLVFNPTERLAVKNWGEAFNPPNIRQYFARKTNGKNNGNPNLKPEKAQTLETEVSYAFPKWFVAKVTAFQGTFKDVIDAPGTAAYSNLPGRQRTAGFEVEINGEFRMNTSFLDAISLFANATHLASAYNENNGVSTPITDIAPTIYNAGITFRGGRWSLNAAMNHVGERTLSSTYHSTVTNLASKAVNNLGSYEIVDVNLIVKDLLLKGLSFELASYNAMNATSFNPAYAPDSTYDITHEARRVMAKLRFKF